ncbi:MAG: C40 family peptidase [Saprospiraceae bacterium]|nr:C40 family peptidase [Saprospiraceae bacterium]MBK8449851.1 C40 family peptidase [Saprospiraceae bacterium]MBK9221496.1 C40 family peptidase [Saprospiraceae bacterium]MBK9721566.1 C40 family peptidase [Saprospiraceae bacterium]MBK9728631.1 C40 family peptidase [Saprospiraceae bacterium]
MKLIVGSPVIQLRKERSHKAELTSQLLYGESLEVLDTFESWSFVKCLQDAYTGWIESKSWLFKKEFSATNFEVVNVFSAIIKREDTIYKVPFGSILDLSVDKIEAGTAEKKMDLDKALHCLQEAFLNAPYLWGGKTGFGIDCSGLTQLFYRLVGLNIERDASLQCKSGDDIFLSQIEAGDLLFFKNEDNMIIHVGIAIDNYQILHASGTVRIDRFDESGIFNSQLSEYTHVFAFAKRFTRLL